MSDFFRHKLHLSPLPGALFLVALLLLTAACGSPTKEPVTGALTPQPSPAATEVSSQAPLAMKWERTAITGTVPSPRKDATLVYDDVAHTLWLFGGRMQGAQTNELWAFDIEKSQWRQVAAGGAPPGRWGHVAVFDGKRRQMVVFSGQTPSGFLNDVWTFDIARQEWRSVAPAEGGPSVRYGSCAGYDAAADLMYISHGFTNSGRFDDTWAFDLSA